MIRSGKMLFEVLGQIGRKPATISYPVDKVPMPSRFRGKIVFHAGRCVGCRLCVKDCPSRAITINKIGEKHFEAIIDLDRCIFCAQCVDSCKKMALESTAEYELATMDKASLRVNINIDGPEATMPAEPAV
jgi:formate hydrogenlyase subunit 6/NADH:ubiquinone oxidoreductase subunit I